MDRLRAVIVQELGAITRQQNLIEGLKNDLAVVATDRDRLYEWQMRALLTVSRDHQHSARVVVH